MNCQEVVELMQRHMDGDLDQREITLMMAHVGGCPECAVMLKRLQRLSDDLSQLPRVELKFSIVDAIMPQLDRLDAERLSQSADESQVNVPKVVQRSERPRGRLLSRIAGVVAVGVVAGVLLMSQQLQLSNSDNNNDAAAPGDVGGTAFSLEVAEDGASKKKSYAPAEAPQANAAESTVHAEEIAPNTALSINGAQEPASAASQEANGYDNSASIPESDLRSQEVVDQSGMDDIVTMTSDSAAAGNAKSASPSSNNLSAQATALVSPDGLWRAVALEGDGTLRIYATKDDSVAFQSEQRSGSLSRLAWDPDSKRLTYTWTDEQGKETNLAYDVELTQEIIR